MPAWAAPLLADSRTEEESPMHAHVPSETSAPVKTEHWVPGTDGGPRHPDGDRTDDFAKILLLRAPLATPHPAHAREARGEVEQGPSIWGPQGAPGHEWAHVRHSYIGAPWLDRHVERSGPPP